MNSTNQLEECMGVSYATFLVPIQEGLNKRYVVQQLLDHAGDDPASGLIKVPADTDLVVLNCLDNSVQFYRESYYVKGCYTVLRTNGIHAAVPTAWKSIEHLKRSIITKQFLAKILWERPTPEPEKRNTAELPKNTPRTAIGIADAALQHIKDRASTYDSADGERSAVKTAQAFNAITGKDLTEAEVFLLLQILKDVRQWQKGIPHQDSLEDCIAYAALKAEALER